VRDSLNDFFTKFFLSLFFSPSYDKNDCCPIFWSFHPNILIIAPSFLTVAIFSIVGSPPLEDIHIDTVVSKEVFFFFWS